MSCRFTIYCHTNKVNGKRYIGQTVDTMEGRWMEHVRAAKKNVGSRVFGAAIRKYGDAAFDHEVLEVVVGTQKEADDSETKWIAQLCSRSPKGYNLTAGGGANGHHHEDSKRMIGEASSRRLREMSPERLAKHLQNLNTPARLARIRETNSTKEFREKVRSGQKKFWARFTPEEKTRRVLHQQAGMSHEEKSDRVRRAWAGMTPEAREARVRKARTGASKAKSTPEHAKKMSEWKTAQMKLLTPDQRQAIVLKSWETRRVKYGKHGGRAKTSGAYSEGSKKGWANMTPEARAERALKMHEGKLQALARKNSRLVRINLLSPSP